MLVSTRRSASMPGNMRASEPVDRITFLALTWLTLAIGGFDFHRLNRRSAPGR